MNEPTTPEFRPVITRIDFNLTGDPESTHYSFKVSNGVIHTHGPDSKTPEEHAALASLGEQLRAFAASISGKGEGK